MIQAKTRIPLALLCCSIASIGVGSFISGCSSQEVYNSTRQMRIQECEKTLAGDERQRCVDRESSAEAPRSP